MGRDVSRVGGPMQLRERPSGRLLHHQSPAAVRTLLLVLSTPLAAGSLAAQLPAMDLRGVDPGLATEPVEVLTLGSTHLSGYEDRLTAADLDDLRTRLLAYAPHAVAVENVPGPTCELLRAYPEAYARAGDRYCYDPAPFRAESGLAMDSALAIVRETVPAFAAADSVGAAERRRLAAAFLAADDRYSALVQWLRLPAAERLAGGGLGPTSAGYLDTLATRLNESVQLGARVAAALGHERVYPVDDHSADEVYAGLPEGFWSDISARWESVPDSARAPFAAELARLDSGIAAPGGVLELYRAYNRPAMQRAFADFDFRVQMNDATEAGYGRTYLAWWQARNLRMAASIVVATADVPPGGRVLCVVGASHKAYYDAYLDPMHNLRLGDAGALLE